MQLKLNFLELELLPAPPQIATDNVGEAQRCSTLFIESLEQHGRGILSYG